MEDKKKTISELANNPLNIRATNDVWKGQNGKFKGFVRFTHDVWGYRAAIKILLGYIGEGFSTPGHIIMKWAPETENNVAAYTRIVCNPKVSTLVADRDLMGVRQFFELIYMMTLVERGKAGDYDLILKAWGMARKTLTRKQYVGYLYLKNFVYYK